MGERKAIATIDTENGEMTIYYNGIGQEMTAEKENYVESIGYKPESFEDASDAVYLMYGTGSWCLEWIEQEDD